MRGSHNTVLAVTPHPSRRRFATSIHPLPQGERGKKARASQQPLFSSLLPLHRLPADVAAAEAFGPVDPVDRPISPLLCLEDRFAGGANVQHAAAIGEDLAILRHRAGMEDLDAFNPGGGVEPPDRRALAVVA